MKRLPRWLTAELTYRCPLNCFYCSNPVKMSTKNELTTAEWVSVFHQARELGSVQLGFTGGEPLMRQDLTTLVKESRQMGYYTNLITSAVGMTRKKIEKLAKAGLDSVQISFQAENKDLNDFIGGKQTYEHKKEMMHTVKDIGLPLTLNVVLHRLNIDRMKDICAFCEDMQPDHVELASTQFHGWAYENRRTLMPTPDQVRRAQEAIQEYQASSSSEIYYVLPDLIQKVAKRCHQGWGSTYICVNPQGDVTPCLSAHTLPSLKDCIPNVRTDSLDTIWNGPVFAKYQGIEWMTDLKAKANKRREDDLGGCRCQAYLITDDECTMDPVDESSMHHTKFCSDLEASYNSPTELKYLKPRTTSKKNNCSS